LGGAENNEVTTPSSFLSAKVKARKKFFWATMIQRSYVLNINLRPSRCFNFFVIKASFVNTSNFHSSYKVSIKNSLVSFYIEHTANMSKPQPSNPSGTTTAQGAAALSIPKSLKRTDL
jgi:hypothetical protein